jgi:hypothetical protein
MTTPLLGASVALPSVAATGEVWLMAQETTPKPRSDRPNHPAMAVLIRHLARNRPKLPVAGAQKGSMTLH